MHILTLEPRLKKDKSSLENQLVYWYPLRITQREQVVSMNFSSNESFEVVEKYYSVRRIAATFPLDETDICFFYFGNLGKSIIFKTFREKPFYIEAGKINYFFSDTELNDLYERVGDNKIPSNDLDRQELESYCRRLFKKLFDKEWLIEFNYVDDQYKYSSEQIAPHPLLHLVKYVNPDVLGKKYYKLLFQFLLTNDFLTHWIEPTDLSKYQMEDILASCFDISGKEIKNIFDLNKAIQDITIELFNKFEFFSISYLASQYGSDKSIIKILLGGLHNLLPKRDKEYYKQGFYLFQPKFIITSIEIHFIQMDLSAVQLKTINESLKTVFDHVEYTEIRPLYNVSNRYRFICSIKLPYPIEPSGFPYEVRLLSDAIKNSIDQDTLKNNLLNEMWVKNIKLKIFTPPQFEDDVLFSLSHNWLIRRAPQEPVIYEDKKAIDLFIFCDYLVFKNNEFLIDFNYLREIQHTYNVLNKRLAIEHNFAQFSNFKMAKP